MRSQNVTMPAATVRMLAEMFTSQNGVDLSAIVNDLGGNKDLATINLGLLIQGKKLDVPETVYQTREKTVYVYRLTHASILKDRVDYRRYTFNKQDSGEWTQDTYSSTSYCCVEDWFAKEEELNTEKFPIPELKEAD